MDTEPTIDDLLAATGEEFWQLVAKLRLVRPRRFVAASTAPNRLAIERARIEAPREASILAESIRASGLPQIVFEWVSKHTKAKVLEDLAQHRRFVPTQYKLRALVAILVRGDVDLWFSSSNDPALSNANVESGHISGSMARFDIRLLPNDLAAIRDFLVRDDPAAKDFRRKYAELCRELGELLLAQVDGRAVPESPLAGASLPAEPSADVVTSWSPDEFFAWFDANWDKQSQKRNAAITQAWLSCNERKKWTVEENKLFVSRLRSCLSRLQLRLACQYEFDNGGSKKVCGHPAYLFIDSGRSKIKYPNGSFRFEHTGEAQKSHGYWPVVPVLVLVGIDALADDDSREELPIFSKKID